MNSNRLYQKAFIGKWSIDLLPKELLMLKLRFAPREKLLDLWADLWEGITDYDELPPACRALMPMVLRRLQTENVSENWKRIHGLDLSFLVGLPRYVWTKNKIMVNQTKRIASHVGEVGIEIMAIKGIADLILGADDGMMRSTVDLDVLIRPEDFEVFKIKMSELGYELENQNEKTSHIPRDEFQFVPTDGSKATVDVHFMANKFNEEDRLTAILWKEKIPTPICTTLFVPSPREGFWLSIANAFRFHNWHYENHLKYLSDAFTYLSTIDTKSIEDIVENGRKLQILQDWQEQVIQLGCDLDILDHELVSSIPKKKNIHKYSIGNLKLITHNYINKKIDNIKPYKIGYALELSIKYAKMWGARSVKGNYWNIVYLLITDILYHISTFILRRIRSLFRKATPETPSDTVGYHHRVRQIKLQM